MHAFDDIVAMMRNAALAVADREAKGDFEKQKALSRACAAELSSLRYLIHGTDLRDMRSRPRWGQE